MDKDNLLSYLPPSSELAFYQGEYYALSQLLKRCKHSFTSDLIKQHLFEIKIKIIKLTTQQKQPTEG